MNRDQLSDWLHSLEGGMYDWVADEIKKELAKPLPEPVAWAAPSIYGGFEGVSFYESSLFNTPLYALPPRKPWVGLTSEDWENTPTSDKQGCERDAELFDWIEQTLKDKNA
jgi:hypothetical protein